MSCITEILRVKGDKEYLVAKDITIETGGTYKGYEWLVTFTSLGHRCGYVAIPEDHKLHDEIKESGYDVDLDVHGGITFNERGTHIINRVLNGHHCTDLWLGFDAAHHNDKKDFSTAKKYWPEDKEHKDICDVENIFNDIWGDYNKYGITIKTKEYMEVHCKLLIEQLIERAA